MASSIIFSKITAILKITPSPPPDIHGADFDLWLMGVLTDDEYDELDQLRKDLQETCKCCGHVSQGRFRQLLATSATDSRKYRNSPGAGQPIIKF